MIRENNLTKKTAEQHRLDLYAVISRLANASECQEFFFSLCTPKELSSLAERWLVARLLDQNIPYRKISEMTGVSTTTITRVARFMLHSNGYQIAFERYARKEKS